MGCFRLSSSACHDAEAEQPDYFCSSRSGCFCLMARKPHSFCTVLHVKNTFPLNFRLKDNTCVTVSIVSKNSYDFDILLPNGSRRTFRWRSDSPHTLFNRLGQVDEMMKETVEYFLRKLPKR